MENIKHIKDKIHFIEGDLLDSNDIINAIVESNPDEVYNLGAISHVGLSFRVPILTGDVTGLGVARLLDAIHKYNPKIKFYQASSSELFGHPDQIPQDENTRMNPISPYAIAKHYGYLMTKFYREYYDMFCVNGILFNHESPRRGLNFVTRKISYAVAQIKLGIKKDKLVLGSLDSKRDWGYAKEYVELMWKMLQQDKPNDYVIGTGESHTVQDFVEEAFNAVDLDWKEWVEIDESFKRPSDPSILLANYGKANRELGWKPTVKFKQLVKIMVYADMEWLEKDVKKSN